MDWTAKRPTKPGWYWTYGVITKHPDDGWGYTPYMVHVSVYGGTELTAWFCECGDAVHEVECLWLGPIEPPEPPENYRKGD